MADEVEVDVVVVGGGVMGSATAWQLAGPGLDVVLLERFSPGHVIGASHGASRLFRHTYIEPEYLDLAEEAGRLWRELEAVSGVPAADDHRAVSATAPASTRASPTPWPPRRAVRLADRATRRPSAGPACGSRGASSHEPDTAGRLHADRAVAALQDAATGAAPSSATARRSGASRSSPAGPGRMAGRRRRAPNGSAS